MHNNHELSIIAATIAALLCRSDGSGRRVSADPGPAVYVLPLSQQLDHAPVSGRHHHLVPAVLHLWRHRGRSKFEPPRWTPRIQPAMQARLGAVERRHARHTQQAPHTVGAKSPPAGASLRWGHCTERRWRSEEKGREEFGSCNSSAAGHDARSHAVAQALPMTMQAGGASVCTCQRNSRPSQPGPTRHASDGRATQQLSTQLHTVLVARTCQWNSRPSHLSPWASRIRLKRNLQQDVKCGSAMHGGTVGDQQA